LNRHVAEPRRVARPSAAVAAAVARRAARVSGAHAEELEGLLDMLRATIELEGRSEYGDRVHGRHPNRRSFLAHFPTLTDPLAAWDERVARVQAAPGAVWSWFERAARERGIAEPPFFVGALVDRLAILTAERARRGQLTIPHPLYFQRFTDRFKRSEHISVYVEGQNVARVPLEPQVSLQRRMDSVAEQVQELFDAAQSSDEAAEIIAARDSLLEVKQSLLDRLTEQGTLDTISFASDCPVCRRERQQQLRQ
jgi:hypothetical protein